MIDILVQPLDPVKNFEREVLDSLTTVSSKPFRSVRVRDIAQAIQYGHTASAIVRTTGPRFLRITDIQDGQVDWSTVPSCDVSPEDVAKYRLCPGDVVFARTGATTGKSYLIRECPQAIFASYLIRLRVVANEIDPRYLAAYFQSPDYWTQIEGGKRGIGQPNVNAQILGDIVMPLPPLEEQRRIVEAIETQLSRLEAGVSALKRAQANLKRYRAAVLKAACEGRLVPTEAERARAEGRDYETGTQLIEKTLSTKLLIAPKAKGNQPANPTPSGCAHLPEGWARASVDQVSAVIVDCPHSTAKFKPEGRPCIDTTCIKPGRIVEERVRFVDEATYKERIARLTPEEGDIIFAREGTVGTAVAVPPHYSLCLGQRVMLMRGDVCILPRYFQHCLNSEVIRSQYASRLVGSTVPHLNVAEVKLLGVPLPPLAEQERIVAEVERRLSVVDELEATITANLRRATRLRQSVLAAAFSGGHSN